MPFYTYWDVKINVFNENKCGCRKRGKYKKVFNFSCNLILYIFLK